MHLILMIILSIALLYVVFVATGLIAALLIARHEIRKHNERWRFG
jgi:hypothetical protein